MKITIEIDKTDEKQNDVKQNNNAWINGIDICENCPNRGKICSCAIPSMYGPMRIIC